MRFSYTHRQTCLPENCAGLHCASSVCSGLHNPPSCTRLTSTRLRFFLKRRCWWEGETCESEDYWDCMPFVFCSFVFPFPRDFVHLLLCFPCNFIYVCYSKLSIAVCMRNSHLSSSDAGKDQSLWLSLQKPESFLDPMQGFPCPA